MTKSQHWKENKGDNNKLKSINTFFFFKWRGTLPKIYSIFWIFNIKMEEGAFFKNLGGLGAPPPILHPDPT